MIANFWYNLLRINNIIRIKGMYSKPLMFIRMRKLWTKLSFFEMFFSLKIEHKKNGLGSSENNYKRGQERAKW